ncbi:MAG: c-type cytochrome biogenesis protein CcmF [marine bacterium B5-7]|nr:MAG: c-type cytochrome biogenesis protein CcmF [marine bacterium B5-7]
MIGEIGNLALILALIIAVLQSVLPLTGAAIGNTRMIAIASPAARAQLLFVALSYACLTTAFIQSDFSLSYVATNSNTQLPLLYKISGVWGAHEGSLLLWVLVLSVWTGAVSVFSRNVPPAMIARVLGVMGLISIGFISFILFTSNPFERLIPAASEGRDLNPLLQDIGLAIHPPMLYMGYVGFSVAFAFAIAALLSGRLDAAWTRWMRPWTNIAWVFLTVGIALGSWWAYYELGWGGWWFWDPVENASFMPWLVGTALIHSLAATEKRNVFKAWTVLLAVFAFSLSLLGTFLVRSGVLTSVHAFASDPARGLFILIFLVIIVGGSLTLYAWRAPTLRGTGQFGPVSRESGILINNILLVIAATSILLGTLFPLIMDALGLGKYSVGPPYFNKVFLPLMMPLAAVIGIGALLRFKHDILSRLGVAVPIVLSIALVLGFLFPLSAPGAWSIGAAFGMSLGFWVILSNLLSLWERMGRRWRPGLLASAPFGFYGMLIAHIGIGIFTIGVTMVSAYQVEKDISMAVGDQYEVGGYEFTFKGVEGYRGPNYVAQEGRVKVLMPSGREILLEPEKRSYGQGSSPMTEAAIDPGLTRDLYVSLGESLGNDSWAVRIYFKPYIRLIWLGCLFMAFGGLLGAADRRYRSQRVMVKEHHTSSSGAHT